MMSLMESVLCEAAATPGAMVLRSTSSAPPWANTNPLSRDSIVGQMALSPDTGQSDVASSSSYVISSSGLIDHSSNCRDLLSGGIMQMCGDLETRDSSPQSTSFDGYESPHFMNHQMLMKKNHGNNKPHRDPTSHRIIEKRRRDRMNNCLTNLSKLIPSVYLKKGRGRIEKTEIIEMAIRYMKHVELERRQQKRDRMELQEEIMLDKNVGTDEDDKISAKENITQHSIEHSGRNFGERYKQGFFDCIAETLRFLAGAEGLTVNEQMKTRLLFHLREYFGRLADCEFQQSQDSNQSINAINGHARSEENDEPLNMSIKRPRASATPLRYQQSSGELPSSSSVSSSGCGSQLRDILETKEPFSLAKFATPKPEAANQQHLAHLPHSAMPSMMQKFASASAFEQKPSFCASASSAADCNGRSISGLLSGSSFGSRSTSSNATTTSQYPSSPGSSVNSFVMESPPGLHSPSSPHAHGNGAGFPVPIFALHPIGLFYVPLTVNSRVLDSSFNASVSMCGGDHASSTSNPLAHQLAASAMSSVAHPVTINVNFNFLPNMANVVSSGARQDHNAIAARLASSCGGPNQNGVILNTAAYASNLRLALKQ